MTKLALPLRVSISAFWLLPLPVRLLSSVTRPLTGGFLPWLSRIFSTGTLLMRVCMFSAGVCWRTSRVPLDSKVPSYRSPRRFSSVSRPSLPLALSAAFWIGSLSRVNWPKVRSASTSSLLRRSTGSRRSLLHASLVGLSGSGVLPAPAMASASVLATSAWRTCVALLASADFGGR
ncbi:hypothetical protein D3C84_856120 [compost metagenome]